MPLLHLTDAHLLGAAAVHHLLGRQSPFPGRLPSMVPPPPMDQGIHLIPFSFSLSL
jgi:hypothetical protein